MVGADLVAEGFEQAAQQSLTAPARNDGDWGDKGQGPNDEVGPVLASTGERRPEHPWDSDAQGCLCRRNPRSVAGWVVVVIVRSIWSSVPADPPNISDNVVRGSAID